MPLDRPQSPLFPGAERMKSLKVTNLGAIRNERNQYKKGKKPNF